LQEGVTGQVADLLEVQLNPEAMRRLATGGTRQGGAYELYLQGRGYLQRTDKTENVKSAVRKFSEALRLDPQYALAHAGLGEAYLAEYSLTKEPQWLEQALSAADRATELNDRLPAAHIDSGVVQTIAGKYEEAIRRFQRALELDPVNASAYRELGKAYAAAGRIPEAESTYQRAIRLRPSFWLGYKDLGVFYYKLGRYAAAEPAFRKVIELTPDNALGYRNLGGLYHLMGRYAEAETTLKKSLAIQPSNSTYLNLGTICFFQGRFREAVTMYEKAIELGAAGAVTWGNLGDAYRWTPEYAAKAPAAFRRAIQAAEAQLAVNPNDADVLSSLAVYRAKLGDRSRSLAEVEKARRLAPSDQNVAFTSVLVFELAGKRERALAALKEALGAGYSLEEARREPELAELRKDPRCRRLLGWGS
jgi:serine/threonine-protein kinase